MIRCAEAKGSDNSTAMSVSASSIRHRGYAIDDEENVQGTRCVAAPILDQSGHAIAALSVSAPVTSFLEHMIEPYSAIVRDAALRVSVQIGFRSQTSHIHP